MCLNFRHLKIIGFIFGINGKLMVLGVPILNHITVSPKGLGLKELILLLKGNQIITDHRPSLIQVLSTLFAQVQYFNI